MYFLEEFLDQILVDPLCDLHIRRLPEPFPRLVPDFYRYVAWDLKVLESNQDKSMKPHKIYFNL